MTKILAIANQKGGVGKTTTAINLGTALASISKSVLVVDLDPQGNASTGLGIERKDRHRTTYDLLIGDAKLSEIAVKAQQVDGLDIVPSTVELSGADIELRNAERGRFQLREALRPRGENGAGSLPYDYVLIDCPPSLNYLTVNALVAAHSVLVPLQCEYFALEGLSQLLYTVSRVRKSLNPELQIQGVVLTMFDRRSKLSGQVADDARENLGDLVYETIVPRNSKIAEAPQHGVPALVHDITSPGSQAYIKLANEVLRREHDLVA
ncbi:MAG: ParA family protein [Neomegalonema sp.]|nr:ParA family protein [Neomegalonema sp.]